MPRQLRIREEFNSYRKSVIPADAPSIQIKECRRAFYAGAQALLGRIMESLDPDKEATENDVLMMNEITVELSEFAVAVREGRE